MSVMVLDAGNSIIKAKIARREQGEIAFPHAFKQLTEAEYANVVRRANSLGTSLDYLRVNGHPYVVGESAERHGVSIQRFGAARYTRDYYGVLAAATLARFYVRSREVMVFGSHPPGDVNFWDDLMKAVIGDWQVEIGENERQFKVTYANTFDEPVGGLMNVLLTEDGQHYQHTELNEVLNQAHKLIEQLGNGECLQGMKKDQESGQSILADSLVTSIRKAIKPGIKLE
jgi:hypothetical protein